METFEIKITGSGTKREIIIALKNLADSIKEADITNGLEFEGPTLMTTVEPE